jgi:hypothetical protein
MTEMETLKKLAADQFGELTAAENKLLEAMTIDTLAQCGGPDEENDPTKAGEWGDDRTIRSSIVRWLCTNKEALSLIDSSGIFVAHARFVGELNLAGMTIPFSIRLFGCAIPEGISLQDASLRNFDLGRTVFKFLRGWRLNVTGSLFLRYGCRANGPVMLAGASISRDLECVDSHFTLSSELTDRFSLSSNVVLLLDRVNVGGRIIFNEVTVEGIVYLSGATIRCSLECTESEISNGIN